ncbi:hypothetical protein B0H19DRAFT_1073287 [Mycena capillaripes]|nr:hypothetical protein B0H19DRAFT_1073287 [Mycena capillaripes]
MAPEFIPEPKDAHRTLIVLLDGTGDKDDKDATNIVLLHEMLYNGKKHPANDNKQLVHYKPGIGADTTESYRGVAYYLYRKAKTLTDQAVATSFDVHLIEAYNWLAKKYQDGDKICIFGFSRGAYTARALAGMLNAMGLLIKKEAASAEEVYTLYKKHHSLPSEEKARDIAWVALQEEWKSYRTRRKVKTPFVEFLGCWDSVNSVGMFDNISLAHTATNNIVRTFRHALALDERRTKFRKNLWRKPSVVENSQPNGDICPWVVTDVEEVWFAGCHCDVGGGSVLNGTRPNLAHIPLRWMIRECFKARTGMIFSAAELAKLGIEPSHLYPNVRQRPDVDAFVQGPRFIRAIEAPGWGPWAELPAVLGHEEGLDALDAFAPMYDQLVLKSLTWQAMESWSLEKTLYNAVTKTWETVLHKNQGAGRTIPPAESTHGGKIRVHRTVRMRMKGKYENGDDKGKQYIPKARVGSEPEFKDKTPLDQIDRDLIEWVS